MKKNNNEWCVYILIKEKKPIYVGCSVNLYNRLISHKKNKDFTDYIILKKYNNKKDAYCAENALIRFISIFGGNDWLNEKYIQLLIEGNIKGLNDNVICY